jgi:hypothetical protein
MPNTNAAANVGSAHIFDLWLSQWRLAILDSNSAQPILASVLNAMLARPGEDPFWQYLQEFFGSPDHASRSFSTEDIKEDLDVTKNPDLRRHLIEHAKLLPPRQAKRLLEHLSCSYSLHGEDAAFWRIVKKALDHDWDSDNDGTQQPERAPHPTI